MNVAKLCLVGALALGGWIPSSTAQGMDDVVTPVMQPEYYCPDSQVTGTLRLVGSATMEQLAAIWSHGFQRLHPQVQIEIKCHGSETALPDMTNSATSLGMMSRPLTDAEREKFEGKLGTRLVPIEVGRDVLAVVVHPQNPIPGFSREQGTSLLITPQGAETDATWKDLGVEGEWASVPVSMHGYTEQSGTRTFLRRFLLADARGRRVTEHASHAKLLEAVADDRGGVGIVSLSRVRPDRVRTVPLAGSDGRFVSVDDRQALVEGRYPLVRSLFLVVPVDGDRLTGPLPSEFVKYVLSREGQQDVTKDGFFSLNRSDVLMQQDRLGWNIEK